MNEISVPFEYGLSAFYTGTGVAGSILALLALLAAVFFGSENPELYRHRLVATVGFGLASLTFILLGPVNSAVEDMRQNARSQKVAENAMNTLLSDESLTEGDRAQIRAFAEDAQYPSWSSTELSAVELSVGKVLVVPDRESSTLLLTLEEK